MKSNAPFLELDTTLKPVFQLKINGSDPSVTQVEEMIAVFEEIFSESLSEIALVFNAIDLKYISSEGRVLIGNFNKRNIEKLKTVKVIGFCMNSFVGKIILNGVFLIQKPPYEYFVDSDYNNVLHKVIDKINHEN